MILAVTGLTREARIAKGDGIETICGGGDAAGLDVKLARALEAPVKGIISFGIAGALDPRLRPGDCVLATRILTTDGIHTCDERWQDAIAAKLGTTERGEMIAVDTIIADTSAKRDLFAASAALAVDMESGRAAQAARARQIPFVALRTISDGADRTLPHAARVAMKPDGSLDMMAILRSVAARPGQIPGLIRTGRESERAFAALVRCRKILREDFSLPARRS